MSIFTSIGTGWKNFWRKNKRGKLFILSIIGTIIFLLSIWELGYEFDSDPFNRLEIPGVSELGNYAWITLGIGGIIMIAGWLYYHDHNKNYKKFRELVDTDSKAQFVRNIDEIEDLAIQLGPDFEKEVINRRAEFHVKTRWKP